MAAETGFLIDGTVYEVPGLDSFTMDEAQVLYDYCSLTLEDFVDADESELADKTRNPGFLRALMHVAYQRTNPKLPAAHVKQLIGAANVIDALGSLGADEPEEDAGAPLASTSEPDRSSPRNSLENETSNAPSGKQPGSGSERSSEEPESRLHRIGGSRSGSPFGSHRTGSAA